MKLILFIITIAIIWFGYNNIGKPLNLNKTIQTGQQTFKQEKTINNVINSRQRMNNDTEAMKERF